MTYLSHGTFFRSYCKIKHIIEIIVMILPLLLLDLFGFFLSSTGTPLGSVNAVSVVVCHRLWLLSSSADAAVSIVGS